MDAQPSERATYLTPSARSPHAHGVGVGLRSEHYTYLLEASPEVDAFEVITENVLYTGGRPRYVLDSLHERYPIVLHGTSLSIGSFDPLDRDYLRRLKRLARQVDARWVSDHLCWTGVAGHKVFDLLPVPLTEEALRHVGQRVRQVQEELERPLVLENPSSYLQFAADNIPEWEFLSRLCVEAGCSLLLDINNVYVSAFNHGYDPWQYLQAISPEHVAYHHVAGHSHRGTHLLDTHEGPVCDEVWALHAAYSARTGGRLTMIEWDTEVPSFDVLLEEVRRARGLEGASSPRPLAGVPAP